MIFLASSHEALSLISGRFNSKGFAVIVQPQLELELEWGVHSELERGPKLEALVVEVVEVEYKSKTIF